MITKIRLADVLIHQIIEQEISFWDFREFFPTLSDDVINENRTWLMPDFLDPATGKIILRVQSYILKCPHRTILIDPCVGNHKPRPDLPIWHMMSSNQYERNLAAAGLSPDDIDYVMCTHLHSDHVGWNTRLQDGRWVPTFPNAKYIIADREFAHWNARHKEDPDSCPWITDSVLPVVEAGLVQIVGSNHELDDRVHLVPTPGHTIDHFSVEVGHHNDKAIITGDMIHSPLQVLYPDLGTSADYDSKQAAITRRKVFDQYCDTSTLFCTAHFPVSSIGRIVRWRDTFKFVPTNTH
jgi:glyoxylase-like metal-dependent hydrolase (beta-lactamase superfamily II)